MSKQRKNFDEVVADASKAGAAQVAMEHMFRLSPAEALAFGQAFAAHINARKDGWRVMNTVSPYSDGGWQGDNPEQPR